MEIRVVCGPSETVSAMIELLEYTHTDTLLFCGGISFMQSVWCGCVLSISHAKISARFFHSPLWTAALQFRFFLLLLLVIFFHRIDELRLFRCINRWNRERKKERETFCPDLRTSSSEWANILEFIEKKPIWLGLLKLLSVLFIQQYTSSLSLSLVYLLHWEIFPWIYTICFMVEMYTQLSEQKCYTKSHLSLSHSRHGIPHPYSLPFFAPDGDNHFKQKPPTTTTTAITKFKPHWNFVNRLRSLPF